MLQKLSNENLRAQKVLWQYQLRCNAKMYIVIITPMKSYFYTKLKYNIFFIAVGSIADHLTARGGPFTALYI